MVRFLVLTIILGAVIYSEAVSRCKQCTHSSGGPVCGSDEQTYKTLCHLEKKACETDTVIEFRCNGDCPCDPPEVVEMDKKTVEKIRKFRTRIQLEANEKREILSNSTRLVKLEVLDKKVAEKDLWEFEKKILDDVAVHPVIHKKQPKKYYKKGSGKCPTEEMSELPVRLIDWFHVLKINERKEEMQDQRIEKEAVLKELKFMDAKLKSMYSELACDSTDDEIEQQVCLSPVKWMFHHLDGNKDSSLSAQELYEIEEINNEHCIKPFLHDCDKNQDGKVTLPEFCRCLCIAPPCTQAIKRIPTILLSGQPRPMPGYFTPTCDEDGFFMPMQCNSKKECWCVDRNGAEFEGSRVNGEARCNDNTEESKGNVKLIPLNINKENVPMVTKKH